MNVESRGSERMLETREDGGGEEGLLMGKDRRASQDILRGKKLLESCDGARSEPGATRS